jgi:hypothetical protein
MLKRAWELAVIVGILLLSVQGMLHSAHRIESAARIATLAGYQPEVPHP